MNKNNAHSVTKTEYVSLSKDILTVRKITKKLNVLVRSSRSSSFFAKNRQDLPQVVRAMQSNADPLPVSFENPFENS